MSVTSRPSVRRQAGLLTIIVLSACTAPLLDIRGVTLTGDRILGLAAMMAVAVIALRGGLRWTPAHSALALFAGTQVLTSMLAASGWPQGPRFSSVYVLGFACFALTAALAGGGAGSGRAARLWIAVGAALGIAGGLIGFVANLWQAHLWGIGLAQVVGGDPPLAVFAAKVTFQEWNLYSSFLVIAFVLALWSWRSDTGGPLRGWGAVASVGAIAQGLVFGLTRAAWVDMAGLAAFWVWARRPGWRRAGTLVLLVGLGFLAQAAAIGASPLSFRVVRPVQRMEDQNLAVRGTINQATVESWWERPFLGKGAGSINSIEVVVPGQGILSRPWNGNLFLFVLHDSGLLGLAALLALLAVLVRMGWRALGRGADEARRSVLVPLLAAGLALLFAYQFTHALWLMYPYVYLGLLTAAMDGEGHGA